MSKEGMQWYWGRREGASSSLVPSSRVLDQAPGSVCTRGGKDAAAELVLEQLEEQWFSDNVVRWPFSRSGSPPGVIDKVVASPFLCSSICDGGTKPRSRRLSDGDHHDLRRHLERDQTPRAVSDIASLPQTPTKSGDQVDGFRSPLTRPPSGPLMGVTEDEEMENDLFAKMLANRPAKLTTINPGRSSLGPLQENQTRLGTPGSLPSKRKPQPRPRRRLKGTKSLTDLEYEELRGFEDLGFEVSTDDLTPHVVRMFPGLQRQGIPPYNSPQRSHIQTAMVQKGLPHVQHVIWPRRPDSPFAPLLDPSVDMKGQLKSWACEMASIVSIEC